jgi:hypothetical protein
MYPDNHKLQEEKNKPRTHTLRDNDAERSCCLLWAVAHGKSLTLILRLGYCRIAITLIVVWWLFHFSTWGGIVLCICCESVLHVGSQNFSPLLFGESLAQSLPSCLSLQGLQHLCLLPLLLCPFCLTWLKAEELMKEVQDYIIRWEGGG